MIMPMFGSRFVVPDIAYFIHEVLLFLEETAEDWTQVVPEAYTFERDCRFMLDVIEPVLKNDPEFKTYLLKFTRGNFKDKAPLSGEKSIIREIIKCIVQAQHYLHRFIEENNRAKSFRKNVKWFFIRVAVAKDYRQYFRDERDKIKEHISELKQCMEFKQMVATPTLEDFRKSMPSRAYAFWEKHIGIDICTTWTTFAQAYTMLYGNAGTINLATVREHLSENGSEDGSITIYGFITLTKQHGFPFAENPEALIVRRKSPELSDSARMEVAKMVIKLMDKFTSTEMQEDFTAIFQWYKGIRKNETKRIEERAYKWAMLKKETWDVQDDTKKTQEQKDAERVDVARRSISFFFQKYMVLWRVGQLQRETLMDVDFPGKGRIKEFLAYCLPLDYANYHYVLHDVDPTRWPKAKPNVYSFLEQLITDKTKEEQQKQKKEEAEKQKLRDSMMEESSSKPECSTKSHQPTSTVTTQNGELYQPAKSIGGRNVAV